ncbi:hypothetical protein TWF730_006493 [Orbilia blumenaviensis]|uniref:Uncharacterized protein n=1 Tax=Orbilia blumenaviensis TaxID=1796055 RepID=A0AAV9VGX1_9PEZI
MHIRPVTLAAFAVTCLSPATSYCVSESDMLERMLNTVRSYGYMMSNSNLQNPAKIKAEGPSRLEAKTGILWDILERANDVDKNLSTDITYFNGPTSNFTAISSDSANRFSVLYENLANNQCQFLNQLATVPARMGLTTKTELGNYRSILTWFYTFYHTQIVSDNLEQYQSTATRIRSSIDSNISDICVQRLYARLVDTFYFSDLDLDLDIPLLNLNRGVENFRVCIGNVITKWSGT